MNTTENSPPPSEAGCAAASWQLVLKRIAIWGMFLGAVYLIRDFFFIAFMTFLFSFLTLNLVSFGMRRFARDPDQPALRRLMTVGVFVLVPAILLLVGVLVGPRLVEQGEHLAGWLSQFNPESETARVVEGIVGPVNFRESYGGPGDARYQKGLEEFRKTGQRQVAAYNEFAHLESWVEAGFNKAFLEAEGGAIRHRLSKEGTSSKTFADWFLSRQPADSKIAPQQLLDEVRKDPDKLAVLKQQWIQETVERELAKAKMSPFYAERFRTYYEKQREHSAVPIPYTFEQYVDLKKARLEGRVAFGNVAERIMPTADGDAESSLRADFEAAKRHELFLDWWRTNQTAKFIRHQVDARVGGADTAHMDHVVSALINLPVDLTTALILSLFICIDFPRLRRAVGSLRETWLKDVYEEISPALHDLYELVGRSMYAQGLIALCNAILLFISLTILGVEHPVLLSAAVFLLCLVPTIGMVLTWVLIMLVAILQPGGGVFLALQASGAVFVVILIETFVLSPRILGRMMELHPVLILTLLPLAQYFFGVWGLILATPVAVYVVHVVILRRGLPGNRTPPNEAAVVQKTTPPHQMLVG